MFLNLWESLCTNSKPFGGVTAFVPLLLTVTYLSSHTCLLFPSYVRLSWARSKKAVRLNGSQRAWYMVRCSIVPGSNWLVQNSGQDKIRLVVHNHKSMYKIHQMSVTSSCCWNIPSRIWAWGQMVVGRLLSQIKHVTWFVICLNSNLALVQTSHFNSTLSFKFIFTYSAFLFLFYSHLFGNIYDCE